MTDGFTVRFWGVRGSVPVSGTRFDRYGGDTTAIEVRCGGEIVVVDLGTGAVGLGEALAAEGCRRVTVLLSHAHYDHVSGLPFFAPLRDPGFAVTIASAVEGGTEATVRGLLRPPYFPLTFDAYRAAVAFADLPAVGEWRISDRVGVKTAQTRHPGEATAFRITCGGRAVACLFDHETGDAAVDWRLAEFAADADLAILDATGGAPFAAGGGGHGHSGWQDALALGRAAGARRIALTHHHPSSDDAGLDRLETEVARIAPHAFVARAGDVADLLAGRLVRR